MPPKAKKKASVRKNTSAQKVSPSIIYDAVFEERISRLFIFRFLWIFVEMWVLLVWAIWIALVRFVHFWYMLVLGKRNRVFWKKELRFFRHVAKWHGYWSYVVNTRPEFIEP